MENIYKLSICIPTYNRAKYLTDCVNSVLSQLGKYKNILEICICDNASQDNTNEIVENFKKHNKNIKYFRQNKNEGADNNFLKAVEIAEGEYCLLLGSDDLLLPGAIDMIFEKINKYSAGIYLYESFPFNDICAISGGGDSNISGKDLIFHSPPPLNIAKDFAHCLGYISVVIFKKYLWDEFAKYKRFIGTHYSHVYIFYEIIKHGVKFVKTDKLLVGHRTGNDSFLQQLGSYNRIKIDIEGYNEIASFVFGKHSAETRKINARVCKDFVCGHSKRTIDAGKADFVFCAKVLFLSFKYYKFQRRFYSRVAPLLIKQMVKTIFGIKKSK